MATSFGKAGTVCVKNLFPVSRAFSRSQPRINITRCLSTAVSSTKDVDYPAVKPKYPAGEWGEIDRKYAWMWTTFKDELLSLPKVEDRISVFLQNETDAMVLQQMNDHPSSLLFREYITKTVSSPWNSDELQSFYSTDTNFVENVLKTVKNSLVQHVFMEHEAVSRENGSPEELQRHLCRGILQCIAETILTHYGNEYEHFKESQLDEDVFARALWECYGIAREEREGSVTYSSMEDILTIVEELDQRVHSEVMFDMVLRSCLPLPEIVSRDEGLSLTSEAPKLQYKPSSYGHKHLKKRKLKDMVAGHKIGDPCEFGLLGFLNTYPTLDIEKSLSHKAAQDCRLALGITSAFTWLAAQAYNQGFNPVIDLTYPLTSQVVLTDGQRFSFLLYQLNTLSLWREANKVKNLCWHTEEMPLYHSIENGQMKELNDDVLKTLVQMFLVQPRERGYDMKPTITDKDPNLHLKSDFIPEKVIVEEIIEEEKYIV